MITKREWKAVIEGNGYWKIYDGNGKEIAIAYTAKTDKILETNAQLIAAAPDLYEALKDVVRYALYLKSDKVGEGNAYINRREIAKAREALAKAEGKK